MNKMTFTEKRIVKVLAKKGSKTFDDLLETEKVAKSNKTVRDALKKLERKKLIKSRKVEPSGVGTKGRKKKLYNLTWTGLHYAFLEGAISFGEGHQAVLKNEISFPIINHRKTDMIFFEDDPLFKPMINHYDPAKLSKMLEVALKKHPEIYFWKLTKTTNPDIQLEYYQEIVYKVAWDMFLEDFFSLGQKYGFLKERIVRNYFEDYAEYVWPLLDKAFKHARKFKKQRLRLSKRS
jgi:DNA-binding Lrp family transcriptional regulator